MAHIAVLVPGIMGSELYLGNDLIWPGPPQSLVFSYKKMPELMRDDLVPKDVIRRYTSFSAQYQVLIDDLGTCGFRETATPPTLVVFAYDWRRDVASSARGLADRLDTAVEAHGAVVEVSLIAHSMGGLVSRYYLESGEFDGRAGWSAVRRLLTLGTPHRGSPLALMAALGKEKRLWLSAEQVKELISDTRFPSLYQLLPPPGEPFAWDEQAAAEFGALDVYDDEFASSLSLVKENLDAARSFHAKLSLDRRPADVRYFFFAGTRQKTISAVSINKADARRIEVEDAGDGTVPLWSAILTGVQCRPVGGEHGEIYKNDDLRKTLAVLLGKKGVLAPAPGQLVEVALRERVAYVNNTVRVALTFTSALATVNGELRVERAQLDAQGNLMGYAPAGTSYPIRYAGPTAEKLGLTFKAPSVRGVYRVAYYPHGATAHAGYDELYVQEAPPSV